MNILIDMNLSPRWCEVLRTHGHDARHWSQVGDVRAADEVILAWARANGFVVLTSDLDFGDLLALTRMEGPSVAQLRMRSTLPSRVGALVVTALEHCAQDLAAGALVTIEDHRVRIRELPFRPNQG